MMTSAKQMPAEHFADFTFVYCGPYAARRYPVESTPGRNPPSFIENTGLFAAAAAVPTIHPTIQMPQRPRGGQDDVATASTAKPPVEYAIHEVRRCPNRALELPAGCW
jgi:hypothetical protein